MLPMTFHPLLDSFHNTPLEFSIPSSESTVITEPNRRDLDFTSHLKDGVSDCAEQNTSPSPGLQCQHLLYE